MKSQKNKITPSKVLVIGSGAWGTSIANLIATNSHQVFLSIIEKEVIAEISSKKTNNNFLPGIKLSSNITPISGLKDDVDFVFIVAPSFAAKEVFTKISKLKFKKSCVFVICSKGIEQSSLLLLGDSFEKITKNPDYAVLSGPNFAAEVAHKMPTVTTIASTNKKIANRAIKLLNNDYFTASYSDDPRTAEICGVVKNIIAIGCGMTDELDLGVNGKSALVMKGIAEIRAICKKLKASQDITNAAGFGDIFLTCSSEKSRNNSLGKLIASGKPLVKGQTYEGITSAKSIVAIAKKLKLQLDLCEAIHDILSKKFSKTAIKAKIIKAILK